MSLVVLETCQWQIICAWQIIFSRHVYLPFATSVFSLKVSLLTLRQELHSHPSKITSKPFLAVPCYQALEMELNANAS
jgi:hypothetical protein